MASKRSRSRSFWMYAVVGGCLALLLAGIAGSMAAGSCASWVDESGRHGPDLDACWFWQDAAVWAVVLSPVAALIGGTVGAVLFNDDPGAGDQHRYGQSESTPSTQANEERSSRHE